MALIKSAFIAGLLAIVVYVLCIRSRANTLPIRFGGTVEPGFEPVAKLFREHLENGVEYSVGGSAFSAYHKGLKVVDLWGGYADTEAARPWKEDSMAVFFSTTKGVAAICIATLVDRGLLDYDKKVASYWPEFAQNGKENITVRVLLNHRAGLSYLDRPITVDMLADQEAVGKVLAHSPPMWEPDTAYGYHALTFGLYLSQLLRRVDPKHRTLGQYFKEEIAEPFGIDFHIGLPLEEFHRTSRLTGDIGGSVIWTMMKGLSSPRNRQFVYALLTRETDLSKVLESVGSDLMDYSVYLNPDYLALEQPSAFGVGAARAVAKLYGILANGGEDSSTGQRLLSEELIKKFISEANTEEDSFDRTLGVKTVINLGFMITDYKGAPLFGHPGAGGMQGLGDRQNKLGMSYVSSYHSPFGMGDDPRFVPLQTATYECLKRLDRGRK